MAENGTSSRRISTVVGALAVRTEGEGPPTVLWHSLFVDDRSWDEFAAGLTGERQLIRIDGPDHGGSEPVTRRYTGADCMTAAVQVLDALGIVTPVDWVGNAWGGHVGTMLAARHPGRVRSLVMLGTPIAAYTPSERRRTLFLVAAYRLLGPVRFIVDAVTEVLLSERTRQGSPRAQRYVEECLRTANRAGLVNAVRSISLDRTDLTAELHLVAAPTLFVTSPDHSGFTPAQAQAVARLVPRGESAVIDGPAYLTPLEAPEATVALARSFWARIGTDAST